MDDYINYNYHKRVCIDAKTSEEVKEKIEVIQIKTSIGKTITKHARTEALAYVRK